MKTIFFSLLTVKEIIKTFFLFIMTIFFSVLLIRTESIASANTREVKPIWAESMKPPVRTGEKCFIGSSPNSTDRNAALAEAYKNALLNVIEREFPDLISISSSSSERLEGSAYSRDTAYKSEYVQFNDLSEDKESPVIYFQQSNSTFAAIRLLCWPTNSIEKEKKRQAELKRVISGSITNTIDGMLPASAKPGLTGKLEVTTVPSGVSILLAATPIGTSNARFERVVSGSYEIVLQKEGYEIESREVVIEPGKTNKVHIEMRKVKTTISIESSPVGATVYINNKPQEKKTPLQVEGIVGEQVNIRVEMDDYFSESRTIAASFRPRSESFDLKPQEADLTVLSTPSGAEVLLNQERIGKTGISKKVEGGKHSLKLTMEGFEEHSEEVEVWKSRPVTLKVKLAPKHDIDSTDTAESNSMSTETARRSEFTNKCRNNQPSFCYLAAAMWLYGQGGKADSNTAMNLFIKSCEWGDPAACFHAGKLSQESKGQSAEAIRFFQFACKGSILPACHELKGITREVAYGEEKRKLRGEDSNDAEKRRIALKITLGIGGLGLFIYGLSTDTKKHNDCSSRSVTDLCSAEETDYDKLRNAMLSTIIGGIAFSFSFAL